MNLSTLEDYFDPSKEIIWVCFELGLNDQMFCFLPCHRALSHVFKDKFFACHDLSSH